jgi:hypothetical protein
VTSEKPKVSSLFKDGLLILFPEKGVCPMENIEETIFDLGLPVNSKAMLSRLGELLDEHGTNCFSLERVRSDWRVRAAMWLVMQQVFGQSTLIDMEELWRSLAKEKKVVG